MSFQLLVLKIGRILHQSEPNCRNPKWSPSDFCLKRAERNLLCKSLPLGCVPDNDVDCDSDG